MITDLPEYLIYSLVVITGFAVGFINTLAGSGSLLSLPLLIALGLDPLTANGTNRVAILFQNIIGVGSFHQKQQYHFRHDLHFVIPAVTGAIIGAQIAVDIDKEVMHRAIGIVLVVMLVVMLLNPNKILSGQVIDSARARFWRYPLFFLIGVYGGFIQAGIGIFILTGLALTAGLNLVRANAVKLLIVLAYTPLALMIFIFNDQVDWVYGLTMAGGNMLGALLASRLAVKHGVKFVKWILYLVIAAAATWMIAF
jgi:uncharacterized membrane protein YfcA